ncbi:MAG: PAS domain-containing protein [Verrucomicrobiota bacterium]
MVHEPPRQVRGCEHAKQGIADVEQRYARLLASVTDYVYTVVVSQGRPVLTSHGPGCEAVTGYTSSEFDAEPFLWHRMIYHDDRPAVSAQAERVLKAETPSPLEHRIIHKDGRLRWIRNTPLPHKDDQGRLIAYDGLVSDITERKRAEVALRQSQERLALVIQGSSDGVWDWDLTTNEVYFSTRWKSMLGYGEDEVGNHLSAWERLLHPDDRERALACLQAYLIGQTSTYELEHRLQHKDGSYRWILSRGVVLRDAASQPVRMAGSHVDMTARKQAEEQLKQAYAELSQNEAALKAALQKLQSANQELQTTQFQLIQAAKLESVGTLAAGVAHEVKNPLQTILLGLEYLANNLTGGNDNTRLVLDDMRDAVTRANTIIRELLQLSAATEFEPKATDLNALVERSLWLIHNEIIASQITVVCKLEPDLRPVRLDRSKVEQVFINLFINALQAMSQGGVLTVTTRHCRFGEDLNLIGPVFSQFKPGDPVVITDVQDTGQSIPEAVLPRIFDPFFTTKPTGVGTGLGLSVVKKIMDLHDGAIHIRNAPLGGVVATLLLRAEIGKNL